MREAKLKLNPEKCIFGVTQGKVFSCLVSTKGIEASSDKIKSNPPNATTADKKSGAETSWSYSSTEQIHCQASRGKLTFI
jgi:hypothetical protein